MSKNVGFFTNQIYPLQTFEFLFIYPGLSFPAGCAATLEPSTARLNYLIKAL